MSVQPTSTQDSSENVQSSDSLPKSGRNGVSPKSTGKHEESDDIENIPEIIMEIDNNPKRDLVHKDYPQKVIVHFRPVGGAPILKQKKFKVGTDKQFLSLQAFLKSQLKLSAKDTVVCVDITLFISWLPYLNTIMTYQKDD